MKVQNFTATLQKEGDMYASFCPELDVASQGVSVEKAKSNLKEAIELFLEHASETELASKIKDDIFITNIQIAICNFFKKMLY